MLKKFGVKTLKDVKTAILKELKESLKDKINDKRQQSKITYKIWDIIICVIVADFASVYNWEDIEDYINIHYK